MIAGFLNHQQYDFMILPLLARKMGGVPQSHRGETKETMAGKAGTLDQIMGNSTLLFPSIRSSPSHLLGWSFVLVIHFLLKLSTFRKDRTGKHLVIGFVLLHPSFCYLDIGERQEAAILQSFFFGEIFRILPKSRVNVFKDQSLNPQKVPPGNCDSPRCMVFCIMHKLTVGFAVIGVTLPANVWWK